MLCACLISVDGQCRQSKPCVVYLRVLFSNPSLSHIEFCFALHKVPTLHHSLSLLWCTPNPVAKAQARASDTQGVCYLCSFQPQNNGEVWVRLGVRPMWRGSRNDWWHLVSHGTQTLVFLSESRVRDPPPNHQTTPFLVLHTALSLNPCGPGLRTKGTLCAWIGIEGS